MQRENIRMLNENYAEKSGKYKQISGLPVDNQENGGIMRMGKTKSPVSNINDRNIIKAIHFLKSNGVDA